MIIKKILNNNVVLSENESNQEIVAMGCGIAFRKKNGESINESAVDKVYTLSNKEMGEKFKLLLAELPIEYIEISNEIIELAEKMLQKKLNDSLYISLTDHIHMAVKRFKKGNTLPNLMIWEIQRFYPEEYAIGIKSLHKINKKFKINMTEDEAGFLAMHFVDGQIEAGQLLANEILVLIEEISSIVKYTAGVEFDTKSIQYYRFITHLKFFAKRVFQNLPSKNEVDEELMMLMQKKYTIPSLCVERITEFLQRKHEYNISKDEQFYLNLHIAKVLKNINEA